MKRNNDLKKRITKDLLKSGFPLEVFVSNILNNEIWQVDTSPLYIDPDDHVTRELDIYALKIYNKEPRESVTDNISAFSHLIIQCKKSNKPWIFFDNAGKDHYWIGFYSFKGENSDFIPAICDHGELIGFTGHRYKNVKRYRSFHVFESEPNKPSQIYEALITVCKALEYYRNIYGAGNTSHFFTPIIVLDGTLWSATLSKKSKLKLKRVNKLLAKFDYIFGDDKRPNKYAYQFVEVITREEFKKSLKEIEKDNQTLLKSWIKFLELKSPKQKLSQPC